MENIAVLAIEKIERESHISGLTERIKVFLEEITGKTIEVKTDSQEDNNNNGDKENNNDEEYSEDEQ
jgi:exosome complex RNA-binding protein Rrp4